MEASELAQMCPSTSLIQHPIPFDFSSPWPGAVNKSHRALSLFSSTAFWVALYAVGSRACLELVRLGIRADRLIHQITRTPQQRKPPGLQRGTFAHNVQQMFAEHLLVPRCRLGTAGTGADNVKCTALLDSGTEKL